MKVHLLGISGAGLSALAGWMIEKGYEVSGCDLVENQRTTPLREKGIKIAIGNSEDHIVDDLDWLIIPNIDQNHPEIIAAKNKGVKISTYFQALGEITTDYFTVAVAGAHGKTTTTLMVKTIFEKLGKKVNSIVGEGIYSYADSNLFIVEACEYKKQFLSFSPDVLLITNIAHDHPDFYKDKQDVVDAFIELVKKVKETGLVIGFRGDDNVKVVLNKAEELDLKTQEYGQQLTKFKSSGWGSSSTVEFGGQVLDLSLSVPGKHNVFNAIGALKIAEALGLNLADAAQSLADFTGCRRRMEKVGQIGKAVVIDDYGHHPDQIKAVIGSVRNVYPNDRIVALFEPHQYERTWQLMQQFSDLWQQIDQLYLLPIYKVEGRESAEALTGVSSEKLAEKISKNGFQVELITDYDRIEPALKKEGETASAIIVFSAGPLSDYIRRVLAK